LAAELKTTQQQREKLQKVVDSLAEEMNSETNKKDAPSSGDSVEQFVSISVLRAKIQSLESREAHVSQRCSRMKAHLEAVQVSVANRQLLCFLIDCDFDFFVCRIPCTRAKNTSPL